MQLAPFGIYPVDLWPLFLHAFSVQLGIATFSLVDIPIKDADTSEQFCYFNKETSKFDAHKNVQMHKK